ncbi:MAG: phosphoglycerate dehydrogenase [Chloroflexota bacterium]
MKILVADQISGEGLALLKGLAQVDVKTGLKPDELMGIIGDYEGLMVRSATQVTAKVIEAGKKLQAIGRAGVGVDNIDVEAATRRGIIVVYSPTGNTISAAEHTMGLMLSLARNIPQANTSLKKGEWRRNEFTGNELRGKTLGIIGLGNVGAEVARRARAFDMRLLGYDPFVSAEYAKNIQVDIVPLEELLKSSDFVTLHVPLNKDTRGLIGEKQLAMMKPTARIINCARGGLIDEELLAKALKEKKLAGAAVDVFPTEPPPGSPLFGLDNAVVTPHLGASTHEAQVTAARDVAEQFVAIIKGEQPRYAINAPFIAPEAMSTLAPFGKVATKVGKLAYHLAQGQLKNIKVRYEGEIANYDSKALKAAVLGGLLEEVSESPVNLVNANLIATQRGLTVVEEKEVSCQNYASLIKVEILTSAGTTTVAGTILNKEPHIVQLNNYWLDFAPADGYFLFADHLDRPGLISAVSKVCGDSDVNISAMYVGRLKKRGQAMMVLALDEPLSEVQLNQIQGVPDIYTARQVKL